MITTRCSFIIQDGRHQRPCRPLVRADSQRCAAGHPQVATGCAGSAATPGQLSFEDALPGWLDAEAAPAGERQPEKTAPKLYVAHPIDLTQKGEAEWPEAIAEATAAVGWDAFDPQAHGTPTDPPMMIYERNETNLGESAAVLALLPDGVPTLGTPLEIDGSIGVRPVALLCGPRVARSVTVQMWQKSGGNVRVWSVSEGQWRRASAEAAAWLAEQVQARDRI